MKTFDLAEVIRENHDRHEPIGLTLTVKGKTKTIEVPHPRTWDDRILELAISDPVAMSRAVLADNYGPFIDAGGSANVLITLIEQATGVSLGESSQRSGS